MHFANEILIALWYTITNERNLLSIYKGKRKKRKKERKQKQVLHRLYSFLLVGFFSARQSMVGLFPIRFYPRLYRLYIYFLICNKNLRLSFKKRKITFMCNCTKCFALVLVFLNLCLYSLLSKVSCIDNMIWQLHIYDGLNFAEHIVGLVCLFIS